MPRIVTAPRGATIASRFGAFVAEQHPTLVRLALEVFEAVGGGKLKPRDRAGLDALRPAFRRELASRLYHAVTGHEGLDETTPGVSAIRRLEQARAQVLDACDGWLQREAIAASLTADERKEILRGMCLTRAVDNRLKQFFTGGEVRWGMKAFQGKGFRSLGQEAIYAAGIRLRRGERYRGADGAWTGDVVAPMIRDLGVALAMRGDEDAVAMVLSAQMGKAGPPMRGKDLHIGDFEWGMLPAAAPLSIGTLTMAGMAMAFWRERRRPRRVLVHRRGRHRRSASGTRPSTCAPRRKLPAVFCVENNQTALSTPVRRAIGRPRLRRQGHRLRHPRHHHRRHRPRCRSPRRSPGPPNRARAGAGPALIELGLDAHVRPRASRRHALPRQGAAAVVGLPAARTSAATRTASTTSSGRRAIRLPATRRGSRPRRSSTAPSSAAFRTWAEALVDAPGASASIAAPWPEPHEAGSGVFADEPPRVTIEVLEPERRGTGARLSPPLPAGRARPAVRQDGPDVPRGGDARRRRRAARRPAGVRLRPGRRRQLRQRLPAAAAAARRSSATASSTRRWPKAPCSASASARRWPASGRSARCSSTTSSPPASTSW